MEIVELSDHPFFVGTQFHPEFKSRPRKPSPPFLGLCLAASGRLSGYFSGAALRSICVNAGARACHACV
jgi:CTP synthase